MTLSVQGESVTRPAISVYSSPRRGVPGFVVSMGPQAHLWLDEQSADRLGRYLLYTEPGASEVPSEVAKILGIEPEDG